MPTVDPIRKAEMTAAAEALVDWVRERRASWTDEPADDLSADDAPADDVVAAPQRAAPVLAPAPPVHRESSPSRPPALTPPAAPTYGAEAKGNIHAEATLASAADARADGRVQAGTGTDAQTDPGIAARTDAAPAAGTDAGIAARTDGGIAAGTDADIGADAGVDAGADWQRAFAARETVSEPPLAPVAVVNQHADATSFASADPAPSAYEGNAGAGSFDSAFTPAADDRGMPVHPPANAAAQWYTAPAAEESGYGIEQPDLPSSTADQSQVSEDATGLGFAGGLFARDSALVRWGIRGVAAAAVLAAGAWGLSRIGPHLTSSVDHLQSSVKDLKSSVSDLKASVSDIAGKRDTPAEAKTPKSAAAAGAATAANGRGAAGAAVKTGRLTVESDPTGARVSIDGKQRGPTPLSLDDLAIGAHVVLIESEKGSVRRNVKITAGATTTVSESIFSGFIKVLAPYELTVAEGNRALTLDERGQALLPPGVHELRFINRQLGYNQTRRVEIEPGQTATVSLGTGMSTLAVTASEPAEVLVDGQRVGQTPISGQSIALGTHDIVVRGASGERRLVTTVTSKPVRLDVDFSKP